MSEPENLEPTNPDHREAGREVKAFGMALRHGWEISDDYRKAAMEQVHAILTTSKSPRNKLNAAKVLLLANKQNMEAEQLEKKSPTAENNDGAALREAMRQLDDEARQAIEQRDSEHLAAAYPGALRHAREQGTMAPGPAPAEDQ